MMVVMPLLLLLLASTAAAAAPKKKPNFLILFLDDHGWGDMGANARSVDPAQLPAFPIGPWKDAEGKFTPETPHMDALAESGIRFAESHVKISEADPALGERTVADILGSAGYETHMIGKW